MGDRTASFRDPYGNEKALKVARDLDLRVESLLTAATALASVSIRLNSIVGRQPSVRLRDDNSQLKLNN